MRDNIKVTGGGVCKVTEEGITPLSEVRSDEIEVLTILYFLKLISLVIVWRRNRSRSLGKRTRSHLQASKLTSRCQGTLSP